MKISNKILIPFISITGIVAITLLGVLTAQYIQSSNYDLNSDYARISIEDRSSKNGSQELINEIARNPNPTNPVTNSKSSQQEIVKPTSPTNPVSPNEIEVGPEIILPTNPINPVAPSGINVEQEITQPTNHTNPVSPIPPEEVIVTPEEVFCGSLDGNGDNYITIVDFSILATNFGRRCIPNYDRSIMSGCGPLDYNLDGVIDDIDFQALKAKFGTTCSDDVYINCGPMDFNLDSRFSISEFSYIVTRLGKICRSSQSDINSRGSYECGSLDINYDGKINAVEYASFFDRFGRTTCSIAQSAPNNVVCGQLDWENNGVIDEDDIQSLSDFLGMSCLPQIRTNNNCGSKDINGDGKIDKLDVDLARVKVGLRCRPAIVPQND